jgi:hypothetical protein
MSSDLNDQTESEGSDLSNPAPDKLIDNTLTIQQCMDVAERCVRQKTLSSQLLDGNAERNVPKFDASGKLVGIESNHVMHTVVCISLLWFRLFISTRHDVIHLIESLVRIIDWTNIR